MPGGRKKDLDFLFCMSLALEKEYYVLVHGYQEHMILIGQSVVKSNAFCGQN